MNIVLPVDNPKFRALIFDFDGLLVDSETVWEQVERALLARHGAEYDPLILNKYIGTGLVAWSAAIVNELFPFLPYYSVVPTMRDDAVLRIIT